MIWLKKNLKKYMWNSLSEAGKWFMAIPKKVMKEASTSYNAWKSAGMKAASSYMMWKKKGKKKALLWK